MVSRYWSKPAVPFWRPMPLQATPLQYEIKVIGFTGAGYQQTDGSQISGAQFLNEAGQVAGVSYRYSGTAYLG